MNWRTAAVRYAANILDDVGLHAEAEHLRSIRVPLADGGGLQPGIVHRDGSITLQSVVIQETKSAIRYASEYVQPGDRALALAFVVTVPANVVTKSAVESYKVPDWIEDAP